MRCHGAPFDHYLPSDRPRMSVRRGLASERRLHSLSRCSHLGSLPVTPACYRRELPGGLVRCHGHLHDGAHPLVWRSAYGLGDLWAFLCWVVFFSLLGTYGWTVVLDLFDPALPTGRAVRYFANLVHTTVVYGAAIYVVKEGGYARLWPSRVASRSS